MTEKDAEKIKEDIRLLHAEIKKRGLAVFQGIEKYRSSRFQQ